MLVFIPVSILGGLIAARKKDSHLDRAIVTLGLASASIPDFVTAIFLQYFLGIKLGWFEPIAALPSSESGVARTLWRLVLPVLTLLIVYFGYIARITRAGAITSFEADYTRTAYMKGLTSQRGRAKARAAKRTPAHGGRDRNPDRLHVRRARRPRVRLRLQGPRLSHPGGREPDRPTGSPGIDQSWWRSCSCSPPLAADVLIAWMNPRARLNAGD